MAPAAPPTPLPPPSSQADKVVEVNANALSADPWTTRAEDLVAMNARGPGCFDFRFYTEV